MEQQVDVTEAVQQDTPEVTAKVRKLAKIDNLKVLYRIGFC